MTDPSVRAAHSNAGSRVARPSMTYSTFASPYVQFCTFGHLSVTSD
jgi:hypothetical protein